MATNNLFYIVAETEDDEDEDYAPPTWTTARRRVRRRRISRTPLSPPPIAVSPEAIHGWLSDEGEGAAQDVVEVLEEEQENVIVDEDEGGRRGGDPRVVDVASSVNDATPSGDRAGDSGPRESEEREPSYDFACSICMEPWSSSGPHEACCILCGHIYGRSCIERWIKQRGRNNAKCPQCNKKCSKIIKLFPPRVAVVNEDLLKELKYLQSANESLKSERDDLLKQVREYKKRNMDSYFFERQIPTHQFQGNYPAHIEEYNFISQSSDGDGFHRWRVTLQSEINVDGARVFGMDASSQILVISRRLPGLSSEHVLTKSSLMDLNSMDNIQLPPSTGAVRDICISPDSSSYPGTLALLASLGRKLSVFSLQSCNVVLQYCLPAPAWSCAWDVNSSYYMYAGLQNGMISVFDIRQTAGPLETLNGLSSHGVHTLYSLVHHRGYDPSSGPSSALLSTSSLGPCLWNVGGVVQRSFLVPRMEDEGVCISLACCSSSEDIVASFRPKVQISTYTMGSQTSLSPPSVSGAGKMGSHIHIKKSNSGGYQKMHTAIGTVNEVLMSKSVIINRDHSHPLFVFGDEATRGLCMWDLSSFHGVCKLRPLRDSIRDVKYASSHGLGFLSCISESMLQVYTFSEW